MKNWNLHIVKKVLGVSAALLIGLQATYSYAELISCGVVNGRTAGLDSAQACKLNYGNGTDKANDIKAAFAPAAPDTAWTEAGHVDTGRGGVLFGAGALKITLHDGGGDWEILDADFWTKNFSSAVIAMHVGGGSVDGPITCETAKRGGEICGPSKVNLPSNFEWLLTTNAMSGTWEYSNLGTGGGLSNWTLWGSGDGTPQTGGDNPPPVRVPEPSSILLFALGLLGLVHVRRQSV